MNLFLSNLVIATTCVIGSCHNAMEEHQLSSGSETKASNRSAVLKIVTVLSRPYMMLRQNAQNLTGNDLFEGFLIDLITAISQITGYEYDIHLQSEGTYGKFYKEEGRWKGMVGDLVSKKVDLALADMTITHERLKIIDFSVSYMNSGVGILYVKPKIKDPDLFSFLRPLSSTVWICVAVAYLLVSLCLYLLAKISVSQKDSLEGDESCESISLRRKFEHQRYDDGQTSNSEAANKQKTSLVSRASNAWKSLSSENESEGQQFTMKNSLWFVTASMLQQGIDVIPPRNGSTRMVTGLWWIFTMILVSSYTANLAAHLTVKRMESPVSSAEDLSNQKEIKYGTFAYGSTYSFFQNSKLPVYSRMWKFMKSDQGNFITSGGNQEGVQRVITENGKYAFLVEQGFLEYVVERNCDLTQIGGLLNDRNYGIAMPLNSPHRKIINEAILTLQEQGSLQLFKKRWWQDFENYQQCSNNAAARDSTAESLDVENIGGIFILLVSGLSLAIVVALVERHFQQRHNLS